MNFIAVAIAVPVLIWGSVWVSRGSVGLGCVLYLLLAAACGPHFASVEFAGVTLSLDRLLLPAVIAAYVGQRAFLADPLKRQFSTADKWLVAFVGLLVANTFLNDWQRAGPDQIPIVPHLLEGYLLPVVLYWIAKRSSVTEQSVQRIFGILAVFGIYLAVTGICEVAGAWDYVFPKYIADPTLGIHFGRARGPFLQSVRLGMYLLVGLGAIWIPLVHRADWGRAGRVLGLALTVLLMVASVLTFTRSIWLGLILAGVILIGMTFEGVWRRGSFVGVVAALLITVTISATSMVSLNRENGPQATAESTSMRAVFAYVSWLMFQDHPLAGCGFGHFPHEKDAYLSDRSTSLQLETVRGYIHHNTFLSLLVELGIFGLILVVGTTLALIREALRLWGDHNAPHWMRHAALLFVLFAAAFVIQMLFHEVSYSPVEFGLFFLLAGLMASASATWQAEQQQARRALRPTTWAAVYGRAAMN